MKTCTKCFLEKTEENFYFDKKLRRRMAMCDACRAAYARSVRAKPGYNEWHRSYRKRNREKVLQYGRDFRKKNPEKSRAYTAKWRKNDPIRTLLAAAKSRSKKYGIEFDLTKKDIVIPSICPVLKIPFVFYSGAGSGGKSDSMSLDRIDCKKGYVKGNVQVMSHLANVMKSSATPEQLLSFAKWAIETYGQ